MSTFKRNNRIRAYTVLACVSSFATVAAADDMVSFATGGYAAGLRTPEMMHKIDTNKDGMVSKDEWAAFQNKVFTMMDKDKSGVLDEKEFVSSNDELVSFATGGYARGLKTKEMLNKMDPDHDGTVSRDEFISYQLKVFDMMDSAPNSKGMLDHNEFFGRGPNKP